ncbi:hypothetical protein GOP47_0013184 [Adiantum capillus-veneris]|uniref:Uncharacterized protein n=1 Tax=Adiantum capillus-veneris TaxID=13818 RepID=A0A9D4UN12_ADICA|nr:hypothetical protein GOP47_0013184 [Adiantum capillus-veneris]
MDSMTEYIKVVEGLQAHCNQLANGVTVLRQNANDVVAKLKSCMQGTVGPILTHHDQDQQQIDALRTESKDTIRWQEDIMRVKNRNNKEQQQLISSLQNDLATASSLEAEQSSALAQVTTERDQGRQKVQRIEQQLQATLEQTQDQATTALQAMKDREGAHFAN